MANARCRNRMNFGTRSIRSEWRTSLWSMRMRGTAFQSRNTAGISSGVRSRGSTGICNDGALASETAQQARRKREQAQAGGKDGGLRDIFGGIDLDQIQDAHLGVGAAQASSGANLGGSEPA